MAGVAGVRDAELLCQPGPDEVKGVAAHELTFDGGFDLRHVACRAFTAGTVLGVMGVFGN